MTKIDLHMHLSDRPIPRTEKMWISTPEEMLPHMQKLGISKAVLMSAGESAEVAGNTSCRSIATAYPEQFAWMCNVDEKDPDTIYKRLKSYKEQGAIGIGELAINKKLDDPFLEALYDAAGKLDLSITFHMSPEVGFSYGIVDDPGLPLLEKELKKYPNTKFVGHSQSFWIEISKDAPTDRDGRNAWGEGMIAPGGRVPELFEKYPNLYGDLSANSAGHAMMRDPDFGLAFLEKFSDRLFFATDMVNAGMVFPLGAWLDTQVQEGRLSKEAYNKICHENANHIFNI